MPESGVAAQAFCEDFPGRFEFLSNEPQAEQPCPHCVPGVLVLLGPGAGTLSDLCHLAQGQTQLDVGLQLASVDPALAALAGVVELEKPEFNLIRDLG